jgi:hypothetical protein
VSRLTRALFIGIPTVVLSASAAPSVAQGLEQPLRSSPAQDPNRTTQLLTLSASALGGYDDPLPEDAIARSLDPGPSGYTGFADVGLRYWRGRPARSFSLDGSGYLSSYSDLSIDSPLGGQVLLTGVTTLGRSNRLEITQFFRTDPYVAFGAFGPLRPDLGPGVGPDANPANGLSPERSWGSSTSASLDWPWTSRTTFTTGYDYFRHEYVGDAGFDNRTHAARLALLRSLTRTVAARATYRYADALVVEPARNASWPTLEHTGELGLEYTRALSPTRHVEFSAGAGATHVETVSRFGSRQLMYWNPSGHASARADVGRTWAVSAAYRRGLTFLDGLSPESFFADVVLLRAEGALNRRVELMFSSGYSNGKQQQQQAQLLSGRYETFTLSAQARVTIARPWALIVNYNRNDHRLFGFAAPPLGPPSRYGRNGIRVGITYSFTTLTARAERPRASGPTEN